MTRFRVKFAWYDLWVGAYIDRAARVLYICPAGGGRVNP